LASAGAGFASAGQQRPSVTVAGGVKNQDDFEAQDAEAGRRAESDVKQGGLAHKAGGKDAAALKIQGAWLGKSARLKVEPAGCDGFV
jgi:hypothetical protein